MINKRVADAYTAAKIDTARVLQAYKKATSGVDLNAVVNAYRETVTPPKPREE